MTFWLYPATHAPSESAFLGRVLGWVAQHSEKRFLGGRSFHFSGSRFDQELTMPTLSAIIITKDEARRIRRCIESVQWADEIVVVDSGSTDETLEICREFTDKALVRTFDNFANQKNAALDHATGEWILSLDADEVISAELTREIRETIEKNVGDHSAFSVRRENYICGHPVRHVIRNDSQVKLLKRGACRYFRSVHEDLDVKGHIGMLASPLLHYNSDNLLEFVRKQDLYTSLEAKAKFEKGERFSLMKLLFSPPRTFWFRYVTIDGYKDGWMGFVIAVLMAYYVFQIHLKMLKRRNT
ncbi:MAG: glycosyltransferase family 2 protein [Lentisphaerae bacterium]|nr:glycosyltransferase family 2 protein [Lentisphaerota bacterium]